MIQIDYSKCNNCGLCVKICHESCIHLVSDRLTIETEYCSTCTQCIAVCPVQALSWDHILPELFNRSLYPKPEQMDELFRERRTIRDFTAQKIDQHQLEEIAGIAIYAPTHDFNLRTIIIDDENIIAMADSLILKFSKRLYLLLFKPRITYGLLKLFTPGQDFEYRQALPKLKSAIKRDRGFKTKPAAMILIIGNRGVPLSLESAQYALYNMDLYAQTKGFACRNLVGNQMILNRNRKFRKAVGLKKKEKIRGTLLLGYPAIRFRNKVAGKKMHVQWNALKN